MLVPGTNIVIQYFYTFQNGHHDKSSCHHTKILQNYWLYSPHCIFHNWLIYFVTESLYLLGSLTYFSPPLTPFPLATTCFFSVSITLFLFGYVFLIFLFVLFFKIPHISEIMHYLCFSVWLISLYIIPSRSIHVVANGKISLS